LDAESVVGGVSAVAVFAVLCPALATGAGAEVCVAAAVTGKVA
jgi:hypothetical protein